jgi:UDP-N-acetylglucosamine--N-acetylmuramyl-(pentapeptide) pyrophosphoryl-undecaprenol N-acetylglucosamine transferase
MIMAGGTGGHVMPALAVAKKLQQRGMEVRWIGHADGLEATLVPEAGFELDSIRIKGLRQSGIIRKLIMPFMLVQACFQALIIILKHRPDAVLGMGGFVSGPGGLVAALLRKPLLVHEQNAVAGLTNRGLSLFTTQVLSGFPIARGIDEVQWVGNPVRQQILDIPAPSERLKGRDGPLRILVVGGSQGAQVFNVQLPGLFYQAQLRGVEVWHQCGRGNLKSVKDAYKHSGIKARVEEFVDDMGAAYAWSDIVICRAGAMTVSEICAAGAVALFVPYPYAVNDHQTVNASYLAKAGAAMSLSQGKFVAGKWTKKFSALEKDRRQLVKIASKARAMAKPDAANRVADICEALVHA